MTGITTLDGDPRCLRAYDRIAPVYDLLDAAYERAWKARLRAELFRHARGDLLDVGVGTGCNLPFYRHLGSVVGVDLSPAMLAKARRRAEKLGIGARLEPMNVLDLQFPDASFDTVSITFVLLCLPEALQLPALQELARVCKPDGQILVLDYQRSSHVGMRLLGRVMSPWMRWAFAGRYDADLAPWLAPAGLRIALQCSYLKDAVTLMVLTKPAVQAALEPSLAPS